MRDWDFFWVRKSNLSYGNIAYNGVTMSIIIIKLKALITTFRING